MSFAPAPFKRWSAPLRAALALVVLLAFALQQGTYAGERSHAGMSGRHVAEQATGMHVHSAPSNHEHRHAATAVGFHADAIVGVAAVDCYVCEAKAAGTDHDDGSCEVHCAPCPAVPVACLLYVPARAQVRAEADPHAMTPGGMTSEVRPPRRLA